jgi:DNA-binding LacI/PurR family transcriptional regulator
MDTKKNLRIERNVNPQCIVLTESGRLKMGDHKIRTMEEFAAASGLSRPTVSKFFDNPQSVKPSTRARIEKALKDYNYQPNIFAVSLNRKRPKNIGVIVPHISDPFYAEIIRQIETRCLAEGYWTIVLSSHGDRKLEARAMRSLMSLKIAGVMMAPLGFETDAKLLASLSSAMPVVFLDNRIGEDQPFVGTDNLQSIGNITEYLLRTGENPCFLEMPAVNQNALDRRAAYVATMERLGADPIVLPMVAKSWNFEELGYQEAGKILDRGGFPSRAVLCANDRLAFGVISAAFERRRHVGREEGCDLRVAGHDDHPLSRFTCPPLTTVAQDYQTIAQLGLDMLFSRINAQESGAAVEAEVRRLGSHLIMRGSA